MTAMKNAGMPIALKGEADYLLGLCMAFIALAYAIGAFVAKCR